MDFTEADFRHCMGCFTTGVTVVTTTHNNNLHGVTINSFASLSLDPFLVLFNLDKKSHIYSHFADSEYFTVNILAQSQLEISRQCAHPSGVKWNEMKHSFTKSGCPVIEGAVAYIDCKKEAFYEGGDHTIFIGKVLDLKILSDEGPLLYNKGKYTSLGNKL